MTNNESSEASVPPRPGRLGRALVRIFMKRATVVSSEPLGPGFQRITLESAQFRTAAWTPGQKLQIAIGSAFISRTYTPVEWDAIGGRTTIIAYAHGDGPGSNWVRSVKPGDECDVFGPRASLDVTGLTGPAVLFGDETSFGLAVAIARQRGLGPARYFFEANSSQTARSVLEQFDIKRPELFARMPDDVHLEDVEKQLAVAAASSATFVLTGKATSIRRLRQLLRTLNVPSARLRTKAYWAPGKTGLD